MFGRVRSDSGAPIPGSSSSSSWTRCSAMCELVGGQACGSCRPSSAKRSRTGSSAPSAVSRSPVVPAPAKRTSIFPNFSRKWDSVDIGRPAVDVEKSQHSAKSNLAGIDIQAIHSTWSQTIAIDCFRVRRLAPPSFGDSMLGSGRSGGCNGRQQIFTVSRFQKPRDLQWNQQFQGQAALNIITAYLEVDPSEAEGCFNDWLQPVRDGDTRKALK